MSRSVIDDIWQASATLYSRPVQRLATSTATGLGGPLAAAAATMPAMLPTIAHSIGATLPASAPVADAMPPNRTGLPDGLKRGIETLSGLTMDDVRVHRNSAKPGAIMAHAFAQGSHIHLGPGQERHLPHEAWHIVQQKQQRVPTTMQLKGGVPVNDDAGLEREADVMGARALAHRATAAASKTMAAVAPVAVAQRVLDEERAALTGVRNSTADPLLRNIVGEAMDLDHVTLSTGPDPERAHAARTGADPTQHEVNLDPAQLTDPLRRQSHLLHELIHVSADRRYNANADGDRDPALTAVVDPNQSIADQDREIGRQSKHRYGLAESLHNSVDDDEAVGDDIKALVKDRATRAMGHPHRELDSVSSELYYEFHRRGVDPASHTFAKVKALAHGTYRSRHEGVPLDQVYVEPPPPQRDEGCCCVVQ